MARDRGSDAGALVVELLAFLREPARERPRYTVGREPIEGGDHVLRFAQGKFPPHVLARTTPAERLELREAAQSFIRQVCFWDNATHYQLLCAPPDASRAALKGNYHLLMALIHPDRRDADSLAWPRDCAQRVNRAYETLIDTEARREYDASLGRQRAAHIASSTGSFAAPDLRIRHRVRWPRRLAAAGLVLGVLALALLGFEAVFSDHHRETLAGLWTGARSSEEINSSRPPRYIGSHPEATVEQIPEKGQFEVPVLTPLWRAITGKQAPAHEDARAKWSPPPTVAEPPPPTVVSSSEITTASSVVAKDPEIQAPVVAPASPPPASPPPALAPPALAPGVPARDIEVLVVRLVDSYEAGDVDRLMALVDSSNGGFWTTSTMRQSYADFFRATRARTLHVSKLDWRNTDHEAHARGQALLRAEYEDQRGVVERNVDLEMDIAVREGQPRIVRLKLFPNAS